MVLISSNTDFTEFLHVLPWGIVLWKINCLSNQEAADTVSPCSPCFGKALAKRPLFSFQGKLHWTLSVLCSWTWFVSFTDICRLAEAYCWISNLDIPSIVLGKESRLFTSCFCLLFCFSLFVLFLFHEFILIYWRNFHSLSLPLVQSTSDFFTWQVPWMCLRLKICACYFRHFLWMANFKMPFREICLEFHFNGIYE